MFTEPTTISEENRIKSHETPDTAAKYVGSSTLLDEWYPLSNICVCEKRQ